MWDLKQAKEDINEKRENVTDPSPYTKTAQNSFIVSHGHH